MLGISAQVAFSGVVEHRAAFGHRVTTSEEVSKEHGLSRSVGSDTRRYREELLVGAGMMQDCVGDRHRTWWCARILGFELSAWNS